MKIRNKTTRAAQRTGPRAVSSRGAPSGLALPPGGDGSERHARLLRVTADNSR